MDGEKIPKPEATNYLFCNRVKQVKDGVVTSYTYDVNDRLTEETGARTASYTYDKQGNTLTQTVNGVTTNYSYNAKHELIQANEVSFNYDIDGVRSSKTKDNTTISYTTDKNRDYAQVVLEKQNNQTVASYTYGDDLLSQTVATGTNFYGYDGLGSTKFLTDTNGQITDTYQYDAYGEITSKTGTTDNNYLYTGEQYDRSLNQYYLRARYYNQGVGRFTQMDTWQGKPNRPSSLNKYLYAEANPVMFTDPSGNTINISGLMAGVNGMRTMSMVRTVVAQGGGAAARVLGIGGSSSSAAGGMVIANRLGLNYFKTIYRNCRGRGRKNDVCNYAKGFVEAHLKMRAMVALTPNSARNRKKNRVFTVAGAFDYKHGKGVAAFNGEHRNTSKRLVQHARRMGLQIGGCYGSVTAGRCAEFRAADKLIRGRSKIKDIRWTWAYSVDKNKSTGFLKINGRKDYCHVCQTGLNVRN